ncbi:MAG: PAS domain-containing hybrid sensor histidine kinase/response regulator [Ignavibacteriaceae bacterium]
MLNLFYEMPVGAVHVRANHFTTNNLLNKITGFEQNEIKNIDDWFNLLFDKDAATLRNNYENNKQKGFPEKIIYQIKTKTGEKRFIEFMAKEFENEEIWIINDITEKKHTLDQLKESGKKLSFIYNSTSDLMFLISVENENTFRCISVNESYLRATRLDRNFIINKKVEEFLPPKTAEFVKEKYTEAALTGKIIKYVVETQFSEEHILLNETTLTPILDDQEKCVMLLGSARDITESKIFEHEIIRTKEKAEEANRLKSSFLSNMSHEIRTPLNGILGFAELLTHELENEEHLAWTRLILSSSRRLLSTLNSIIELSLLESEKINTVYKRINLKEFIPQIIDPYIQSAVEKGLAFDISFEKNDIEMFIDPNLLKQIIFNVIDNAIKFTRKGAIALLISEIKKDSHDWVRISVKDTGIGIDDKYKGLIFEDFRQVSEGMSRSNEGLGIGLSISKKMTELMNGSLTLESKVGEGSTFEILLPSLKNGHRQNIHLQRKEIQREKQIHRNENEKILLVEDNQVNRDLTRVYLKNNYNIDFATNIDETLEKLNNEIYKLVLMDINLGSDKNGIDILEEIRKIFSSRKIPVIAVTGYAMPGDREYLLKKGFSDYIEKPFSRYELLSSIRRAIA